MKILLEGVSLFSDNRGVNALGIGAISLLASKYHLSEINVLAKSKDYKVLTQRIQVSETESVNVKIHFFNKKDYIISFFEAKYSKIPKSRLSKLISIQDFVYNVNEGDSFSDIYGPKRILSHAIDSWLALAWKKPLIFLPQTIGPFNTIFGRRIAKSILTRLTKLYVRDKKALHFIGQLKLPYQLNIDMAVYMRPKDVPNISLPKKFIGFNINGLMYFNSYKSMKNKYQNYQKLVHAIITKLTDEGHQILLVPHTYNADAPNFEDDLSAVKHIYNKITEKEKAQISMVENNYDAQELKYIISKSEFFIGSRMHACIAALSSFVPCVGLSYSYKFDGTFSMFRLQECVINVADIKEKNIEGILTKTIEVYSKRGLLQEKLMQSKEFRNFNW